MRAWARAFLLRTVSAITGRHAALLGAQAADEQRIFRLAAPYRVATDRLHIRLLEPDPGQLAVTLLAYEGHFPRTVVWRSAPIAYPGPASFTFDLSTGGVAVADRAVGQTSVPDGRRFCWRFELDTASGTKTRLTGHYRPAQDRPVDRAYYYGDDYVDYAAQSQGDGAMLSSLLREFAATGPVLEIGCATGQVLAALAGDGRDVYGLVSTRRMSKRRDFRQRSSPVRRLAP
jgi:hypothetical protein